jgi:non-homologous end joining protein Ku
MNDVMQSWRWHYKVLKNEGLRENITDDPVHKRFLGLARQIKELCSDDSTIKTVYDNYLSKRNIIRDRKKGLPLRKPAQISVAMEIVVKACESLM